VHIEERRKQQRIDVDEIAYIFGDGASLRCRVINVSEEGAAIELPAKQHINSSFKLMFERDRSTRTCRLIWSINNMIGVAFENV